MNEVYSITRDHAPLRHILAGPTYLGSSKDIAGFSLPNLSGLGIE